jgi:hypothetical protein
MSSERSGRRTLLANLEPSRHRGGSGKGLRQPADMVDEITEGVRGARRRPDELIVGSS